MPLRNRTSSSPPTASASSPPPAAHEDTRASDPDLTPITYYPPSTQRFHARMAARVARTPYAAYFHTQPLYMRRDALAAGAAGPLRADAVLPLARTRDLLLQPQPAGAAPNGWFAWPDGTGYVASRTLFPGCTGEMVDWWFWWHSVAAERYAVWNPYSHAGVRSSYAARGDRRLERDDLPHGDRWLGSTHTVSEYIGARRMRLRIEFVPPATYGLPGTAAELREAGCEAAVCGRLWDAVLPLKIGDMVHVWMRRADADGGGLELRSRYYLGHEVYVELPGGLRVRRLVDWLGGALGIKRLVAGERVAYEQLLHDQMEFTNLASILPGLFREFGGVEGQGRRARL